MSGIAGALIYLRVTSLKNAIKSRIARLKQPKYLVGAIIGVAYLYLVFGRRSRSGRTGAVLSEALPPELITAVLTLGAISIVVVVALLWLWPRERASLSFSETEIAFLFPAPISRKALIHFHLISSQLKLLFTSIILAVVSSGWNFVLGNAWMRVFAWWLLFSTVTLHLNGSAFTLTKLQDRGLAQSRRQLIAGLLMAGIVAIAWFLDWRPWPRPTSAQLVGFLPITAYFSDMLNAGFFGYLLLPAKWMVAPLFAADVPSFLRALGPALGVYAAHYLWVLYSEASYEEASIVRAQKRAARIAAMRSGNTRLGTKPAKAKRTPFDVSKTPRPELAFLWKNLLSSADYLRLRTAVITAFIFVGGCLWLERTDYAALLQVIGTALGIMGLYALVFGPMLARQDLRSDLLNIDVLKTYPLRGWQIVLGQILTPTAVITVLLWLMLLIPSMGYHALGDRLDAGVRVWGAIGVALLIPFLCAIQVLVLNAAALLFPAWIQTSGNRTNAGIDVMGQRILFFVGLVAAMIVGLVPAAIVGAVLVFSFQFMLPLPMAIAAGFAGAVAVLAAEIVAGVLLLGKVFDNFDLSDELRP